MHVIIRSYADEPRCPVMIHSESGLGYVLNVSDDNVPDDGESGVGFPLSSVFGFNEESYTTLRKAWERGDMEGLRSKWEGMQSILTSENH